MYAGTLVQGKTRKPDFRRKAVLPVDEGGWDRVPGAHEPIVDRATFDLAQKLAGRDMRLSPGSRVSLLLSGYVFCANCGATMARHAARRAGGARHYCSCETHRKDKAGCGMHKIWEDELVAAVVSAVRGCALDAVAGVGAVAGSRAYLHDRCGELLRRLESAEERARKSEALRLRMYLDYAEGVIDRAQHAELSRAVDERLRQLRGGRERIERDLAELDDPAAESWEQTLSCYEGAVGVERVMVVELMDRVLVAEDGSVEVRFRFGDPRIVPAAAEGEVA